MPDPADRQYEEERKKLVSKLKREGHIVSGEVARAMESVPRHLFVPPSIRKRAYVDSPQRIGEGQTISAPHMVAIMAEYGNLEPGMKVLEVGGGSGYNAAVMAELVKPEGKIYSVERIRSLAHGAQENLERVGYSDMVEVVVGDGSKGVPEYAPYDRIQVTCAAPSVPEPLKAQLVDGGELLIPVGGRHYQTLTRVKRKEDQFKEEKLLGCAFVPLLGFHGFSR